MHAYSGGARGSSSGATSLVTKPCKACASKSSATTQSAATSRIAYESSRVMIGGHSACCMPAGTSAGWVLPAAAPSAWLTGSLCAVRNLKPDSEIRLLAQATTNRRHQLQAARSGAGISRPAAATACRARAWQLGPGDVRQLLMLFNEICDSRRSAATLKQFLVAL